MSLLHPLTLENCTKSKIQRNISSLQFVCYQFSTATIQRSSDYVCMWAAKIWNDRILMQSKTLFGISEKKTFFQPTVSIGCDTFVVHISISVVYEILFYFFFSTSRLDVMLRLVGVLLWCMFRYFDFSRCRAFIGPFFREQLRDIFKIKTHTHTYRSNGKRHRRMHNSRNRIIRK